MTEESDTSEYDVTATAAYAWVTVEASSAEEAIRKSRTEIADALYAGEFQLSEIEAHEKGGDDYAIGR